MENRFNKLVALMLTVILLTSVFPTMTISSAESEVSFDGSFAKSSYTMELGETLDVKVNASVTNANLTRVTVNVDGSGVDRLASEDVSSSDWSGYLTLDSSVYPLNTPGTYTIKLFASADAGDPNWAELDQATLVVTEPEITIDGSFGKSSYTMEVNDTLDIKVKASSENANLTRITVNVDGSGVERHDSEEISGTSWSGYLTLDSSVYPLNTPGTYTIKLFASVDAGDPNWAEVDQATVTVTEVQYDDLVVDIEDPGEVIPGDSLIVRSAVSGGSGDYSYLWTWTHPNGTEMTDTRKNCSILGSVLGTYTFTLTVTDNETGESITSGKLIVEVKAVEEEYDPMEISFVGGEDEVEIELAMVGIAAECSVSGGSRNFEYAWDIERDGVNLQSYSYGMVDESCTWEADKVGVYTFRVTVKDLETGLTESASRSITVVQKEYDSLTLEITSAPTYADIGETVLVSAETTGGVGDVSTSWEVYLSNTCVASGNGLTAQFVPTSDGKYTVIVYAEDEAQTIEDRVTITAGSLVKCDLSVSCDSLYVGGEVEAQVTVQDSVGPFSYEWMLYLNDTFVSSDLDSESTTYSWSATQAGTYRIECTVYDIGKEELVGEMVWATDSAEVIANPNAVISGAFGEDSYTLTAGETLDVTVSASAENASLTRVTVTVDDSHDSEDVSGSSWNGYLTLDGNVYPLNTPGTYTIKLFAKVDAGNPDWAEVDRATLIVTEPYEAPEKLADPVVTVKVDGITMTATWDAVEGAERYVYSLRNLTDYKLIAEHAATNGCTISLPLEAGKQYNLAVGAVPAGITDTIANKTLLSWDEVTFETTAEEEEPEKLANPVVAVKVDGTIMTATWDVVEGAARYVYSLRNLTDDKLIADHEAVNGFSVVQELEYGKHYKFAVAAVPTGISDTHVDSDKCSWTQVEFNIAMAEEAVLSKVLAVVMDDEKKVVQPNEVVKLTVKCNRMAEYLDVYPFGDSSEGYYTLEDYTVDRDGFYIFEVTVKYSTSGKYTLRLVPMNANKDDWTVNKEYWGHADIVVCDHTLGEPVLNGEVTYIGTGTSESKTHTKKTPYRKSCVCGEYYEEYIEEKEESHTRSKQTSYELKHIENKGHREYYVCVCGDHPYTGEYAAYRAELGKNNKCSICHETYQKITNVQTMLKELGYYSDSIDGKWGNNSKKAMENFYKAVKGGNKTFSSIDAVDNAAYDALVEAHGKLTDPTTCQHQWSEPYYKDEHPHNKVFKCKKCGYLYDTSAVRHIEDCCSCVGHLYEDDDYSICLRCGEINSEMHCEHVNEVKFSEHPHVYAYYKCTFEGCPKYGVEIKLDDQFRPDGRELSWCTKCFPQNTIDKGHILDMAKLSQQTYNMSTIVDKAIILEKVTGSEFRYADFSLAVEKTGMDGIFKVSGEVPISKDDSDSATRFVDGLRVTEKSGFPDSFIEVANTADGELLMTISFEGTQGLSDILTDVTTQINQDGVHAGFASVAKDYIYGIFNGEFYIDATIKGVSRQYRMSDIMGELQANPNAHLRITGHSLGGAAAQCLAYYLVKGDLYKIPADQIEVYTYASPIPFTYESIEDDMFRGMNVYNFINVNDMVPDIGVSISDGIITRIAEEGGAAVVNKFKYDGINGGASVAGTNLGTNIYVNSDELANWKASNHSMVETYLPLVEGYIDGSISSYVFDTDVFFSKYYDLNGHKALASFVDIGEKMVNVLKLGTYSGKAGTKAYDLLDSLGMLD